MIGDSFSAAERELVAGLAEEKLGAVALTSSWGASPVRELVSASSWSKTSKYYWASVVPALLEKLRAGDFLVMINNVAKLTAAEPDANSQAHLRSLAQGLVRLAEQMQTRGINIIFQTGNPYMRDAHCTPAMARKQWLNIGEPTICNYLSRAETLHRRRPLSNLLAKIERTHPNFHVLDLMPVLCPGPICRMQSGDTVLYRDYWAHLTIEASHGARPLLIELVRKISSPQIAR